MGRLEQAVLTIASEEGLTWEPCAEWSKDPALRTSDDVERTRQAVVRLVDEGLVWMYRITEGSPDLTEAEVAAMLDEPRAWAYDTTWSHDVALYLTDSGEAAYYSGS